MKAPRFILLLILLFAALTRFYHLGIPSTYYFDEVYHAVTAKAYANNNPAGYEWWHDAPEPNTAYEWLHPPIAKLFMAIGWKYLGQTAWSWRVPGAVFGIGTILVIYWLSVTITKNKTISLIAAGLASLDGLLLAMSRIGMNDIYVTCFMLLAVGAYWKSRQQLKWPNWWLAISSLCTGLAMSTKWSGVFVIGMIASWECLLLFQQRLVWLKRVPLLILSFGILPLLVYIGSYGQFWLQGHSWGQFVELHRQIWWYQTNLKATHAYQSQAWEWPLDIRPVWFWVDYLDNNQVANIYNLGNPFLFWSGLLAIIWMALRLFKKSKSAVLSQIIVIAYAWSWMPWLISPRIMFSYHYTPAVPWLTIAAAIFVYCLYQERPYRFLAVGMVTGIILSFIWLLPLWLGIPISSDHLKYLFLLPSWK